MKTILAFLLLAATAAAQDAIVFARDFGSLQYWPEFRSPTNNHLEQIGLGPGPVIKSGGQDNYEYRFWLKFDLSDIDQPIQRATMRFPLVQGTIIGRQPYHEELLVLLHDSLVYPPLSEYEFQSRDELHAMWEDMGSGAYYGSIDVSPGVVDGWFIRKTDGEVITRLLEPFGDRFVSFPLSGLAVQSLNETRGQDWAAGVSLSDFVDLPRYNEDGTHICCLPSGQQIPFEGGLIDTATSANWHLQLDFGPSQPTGDFDGDLAVSQGDLDFVLLQWGRLTDQEELDAVLLTWGGGLGSRGVPEPETLTLCIAVCMMAAWRKTKSRSTRRRPCSTRAIPR